MRSIAKRFITAAIFLMVGTTAASATALNVADVENLVKRSWQYVAMYNVNNRFALKQGGWNTCEADIELKDHTLREIARPNNDTLYVGCMLDLRKDPMILEMPAFDSKYVSLMITGYDHYVNIPMSTRRGDFKKPEKMLIFSERTQGYEKGEKVEGVDRYFEATGDFISAVFRVMPHINEPERFKRITSFTLYDTENGFFIPNDRKKYSVGENGEGNTTRTAVSPSTSPPKSQQVCRPRTGFR